MYRKYKRGQLFLAYIGVCAANHSLFLDEGLRDVHLLGGRRLSSGRFLRGVPRNISTAFESKKGEAEMVHWKEAFEPDERVHVCS